MTRGRALSAVLVAALLTPCLAQAAEAGTLSVSLSAGAATVRYQAAAGENNDLSVDYVPAFTPARVNVFEERLPVSVGPGCELYPGTPGEGFCAVPPGCR